MEETCMIVCILCSVVSSILTTRVLAIHYFKLVDDYVKDMTKATTDFVDAIRHKQ